VFSVDWISQALWSVDTDTGVHQILSDPALPHGYNELINITGMDFSGSNEYLIGVDGNQNSVFAIDVKTGERVILSKN